MSGTRIFPNSGAPLRSGTWVWKNQTRDNHIDTDYSQFFSGGTTQAGTSSLGEIIRGTGNQFTVYSVLKVRDYLGDCEETVVAIVDGVQKNNGDVSAVYVGTPTKQSRCLVRSAGTLELSLKDAAQLKKDFIQGLDIFAPYQEE